MRKDPRSEYAETTDGWEPGTYRDSTKGTEIKRLVIVSSIAGVVLCGLITLAVVVYLFI